MSLDRAEQDALHRAVLRGEPTASARVAEALLDPLVVKLRYDWPRTADDVLFEQAADSVMNYLRAPQRYDLSRAALLSYLVMDATGDLRNAYDAGKRRQSVERAGLVELAREQREQADDAYPSDADPADGQLLDHLRTVCDDDQDWHVLVLMLEEVRATDQFARVLGIEHLPATEQRDEVKRRKDRLKKRIERGGLR